MASLSVAYACRSCLLHYSIDSRCEVSVFSFMLTTFLMIHYSRLNKAKEARCKAEGIDESRWEEFKDMGDDSPLYRCECVGRHFEFGLFLTKSPVLLAIASEEYEAWFSYIISLRIM